MWELDLNPFFEKMIGVKIFTPTQNWNCSGLTQFQCHKNDGRMKEKVRLQCAVLKKIYIYILSRLLKATM